MEQITSVLRPDIVSKKARYDTIRTSFLKHMKQARNPKNFLFKAAISSLLANAYFSEQKWKNDQVKIQICDDNVSALHLCENAVPLVDHRHVREAVLKRSKY